MPPMMAAIAPFSNFGHQGHSLLTWFAEKSVVGRGVKRGGILGGVMVNHKNAGKNYFSLFQVLNVILDQFVDYKLCIVMYYKFTVHKLVQNSI